ncbi:Tyrosine-protein kinase JAK2 [Halotydeus destructor]|nr:Tyrosine-protein kinase JAK2 [Halotydeus destructor]
MSDSAEGVNILIFDENSSVIAIKPNSLNLQYSEDLVTHCAKYVGIGPVIMHLFGLYNAQHNLWLCPNQPLDEFISLKKSFRDLEFRLRFKPGNVGSLKCDMKAFNYYYFQVRHDFHQNKYANNMIGKVLGAVVTDVLRHLLTYNKSVDDAKRIDWSEFLPQQYRGKKYLTFDSVVASFRKLELKKELENAWSNSQKDVDFVKQEFIEWFAGPIRSELLPKYHSETYLAYFDTRIDPVKTEFQPYNDSCLSIGGVRTKDVPENWNSICSISELCFISVKMSTKTVEISRRNGIPHYFTFEDELHLKSFVSLLDGYYRLMEKWSFCICREISSPHLDRLRSSKCHGPVNNSFSRKKLLEKSTEGPGTYILRESTLLYDELILDVLTAGNRIRSFRIESTQGGYLVEKSNKMFDKLTDLLHQFVIEMDNGTQVSLSYCLPPSEFDQAENLLVCKCVVYDAKEDSDDSLSEPRVIKYSNLHFEINPIFSSNARFRVKLAKWRKERVVIKEVVNDDDTIHFLNTMSEWMHAKSECIVNFFGITMHKPLSLVMEHLPHGPLDEFLKKNQSSLKVVDLIECATYVARALWFLEENKLVHGLIRCHNLMVSSYTKSNLKVKLSDPLGDFDMARDAPWIAPEVRQSESQAPLTTATDTWAFGTTSWEIFSYGSKPSCVNVADLFQPIACPAEVWTLIGECWLVDVNCRKQPQSIVRDVSNIFYEIYNSRNINLYSTPYENRCEEKKSFFRSILPRYGSITTLARSSVTSTTTLWTGIGSSRSDLISISSEIYDSAAAVQNASESESWLIEANQLTLGKVLGQGCYGEVIKAVMTQWAGLRQENVAVKRINPNTACELGAVEDMRKEIEIMKTLLHKNIVEIKGFVEDPQMMLVMEYFELGSLLTYLKIHKSKGFSEQEPICLIKFAADIAAGMEYLETKSIVHRDLAARNILVASPTHVKISDFGLAQFIDPKSNYYRMQTRRGLPLRWYAPESLKTFCFSHQSDVWSFGVTLWEMMSYGVDPTYPGDVKDQHLLVEALEQGVRLQCPDLCPSEVYLIMRACWNKEESQRPSFASLRNKFEDMSKA